ncbi:Uncharacterized conserved protein YafD, endonuclease/exonuclease/phosphatase (EEP) superfamily [Mesonia phycicola]|uniref:Uncharacterized conserved protein YafD, endonuclease/exonuclease/phosphatase (EEP) superfamily n=1 Tax=Mesonia phycicola TaxID=579105 RepID=A0A1M6FK66_9FLAO|nr:endonuclease/exonuclease/phosphatase family protein [Mesonia phycicola]SHI98108.1 Uncharacterized conserved protein YafD, endonuclease/exonuclease/phosphatase (EEP) superfamily [Mesonia phycicola]
MKPIAKKKSCFAKLILLVSIVILALSLIPNIFANYWFTDILANFKFQYIIIAILLLVLVLVFIQKKIWSLTLLIPSIIFNAYYILPYYLPSPQVSIVKPEQLKVTSINLLSSNSEINLVEKYIKSENPEVLILLEFTPQWQLNLQSTLAEYPYKKLVPRTDNFGIALISKKPITAEVQDLISTGKPSIIAEVQVNQKKIDIIATHPFPPLGKLAFEARNKQMNYLIKNRSAFSDRLLILGDFNNSSFSNHFQQLIKEDLKDSRLGFGLLPTWPANFSILQTTLDHCLVSKNITVINRSIGNNIGSDHLPISIEIEF